MDRLFRIVGTGIVASLFLAALTAPDVHLWMHALLGVGVGLAIGGAGESGR